jgi:diguanylate cyclase (GGDEF)-like protein
MAKVISGRARATDLVARLGGDEFAMLLDGARLDDALAVARSVCRVLRERRLELADRRLSLTASAGAMVILAEHGSPEGVLRRADELLYRAKDAGGDCVVSG